MMYFFKKINLFNVFLVCILLIIFTLVSFASEPKYGGVLKVATTTSPATLDTMAVDHTSTREIGMHMFEPLVTFNGNYDVRPMIAKSWEISDDGLVYTFHLREGVPFHNGDTVKAEDVKASVERYIKVSPIRDNLGKLLKEISVLDDYTVEIRLNNPSGAFLANLATPKALLAIMPKEVVENAEARKIELIGTGPYKFVEWIPDRHVKIERFEDYKPYTEEEASGFAGYKKAYIDEIYFIPVTEAGAREASLVSGDYDFVDFIPGESVPNLKTVDGITIVELMPYTWPVIYINHSEDSLLSDLRLRKAVQAGLDHEEIMIASCGGSGRLDPGMYFKEQVWHTDVGAELYNQNDQEKAKKLMEEAGYDNEELVILTNTDYDYMYKSGIVLEKQLKNLGFNAKLMVFDWPGQNDYKTDMSKWELSFSSHSTRFDPSDNDNYFLPETTFFAYDNPEMVEALKRGMNSTLFEDRYKAYEDAQRIFYDDVPMIKLYDLGIFEGYQNYVKDYEPFYIIHFVNVWMDK